MVASLGAFEAAELDAGPADEALDRMVATSWGRLVRLQALARGASEHLTPSALHRSHQAMVAPLSALIERGQRDGVFRTDLPVDWLVTLYLSLVHGADEHARTHRVSRERALEMLTVTVRDLFAAR